MRLSACNRPELRAGAAMMGTSLHTLVQMVDNGLGLTFIPAMAIEAGILERDRRRRTPAASRITGMRQIALIWRRSSPREEEFRDCSPDDAPPDRRAKSSIPTLLHARS